jgi:hypothetical protein
MSRPARIASFGSAGLMVVCGAVCAAAISGEVGQLLAMILIGLGLILATALVFLEVGLSEDRERAKDERRRGRPPAPRSGRLRRVRLDRSRGHRRRL